jgi:chromosomal replication initiator protein
LCARDPAKRVLFLTAAALLTSLIARDTPAFADMPRHVDVLVCDDLGGLRNQAGGVDLFDRAIDDLLANGKQVILAAEAPPSSIEHLPDRLRSRFVAGNSIGIRRNEYDLNLAIVGAMAARRAREKPAFVVPDVVLRMIAAAIKKDARILGAALTRLETYSDGGKVPITFEGAKAALADLIRGQRKIYTVNSLKQQVATRYNVRVSDIDSRSRKHEYVEPRQLAMYLTRRLTERSYPELGLSFKRDHTTVMHGYDKIHARCLSDPEYAAFIEALVESLDDA